MEVVVGTYEQVLVGFDVLSGVEELEVYYKIVKKRYETDYFHNKLISSSYFSSSIS